MPHYDRHELNLAPVDAYLNALPRRHRYDVSPAGPPEYEEATALIVTTLHFSRVYRWLPRRVAAGAYETPQLERLCYFAHRRDFEREPALNVAISHFW